MYQYFVSSKSVLFYGIVFLIDLDMKFMYKEYLSRLCVL